MPNALPVVREFKEHLSTIELHHDQTFDMFKSHLSS